MFVPGVKPGRRRSGTAAHLCLDTLTAARYCGCQGELGWALSWPAACFGQAACSGHRAGLLHAPCPWEPGMVCLYLVCRLGGATLWGRMR